MAITAKQEAAQHDLWSLVDDALKESKGIAWDGCHKIYVLMDDEQMAEMRDLGYDEGESVLISASEYDNPLELVKVWFEQSCFLRLINSVATVTGDPNGGFKSLIEQFCPAFDEDDEDDEDEDRNG